MVYSNHILHIKKSLHEILFKSFGFKFIFSNVSMYFNPNVSYYCESWWSIYILYFLHKINIIYQNIIIIYFLLFVFNKYKSKKIIKLGISWWDLKIIHLFLCKFLKTIQNVCFPLRFPIVSQYSFLILQFLLQYHFSCIQGLFFIAWKIKS